MSWKKKRILQGIQKHRSQRSSKPDSETNVPKFAVIPAKEASKPQTTPKLIETKTSITKPRIVPKMFGSKPDSASKGTPNPPKEVKHNSSLFTSNPAIPVVPKLNVNPNISNALPTYSSSFKINDSLSDHLIKMKIEKPTHIQTIAIPYITNNHSNDVLVQAQTGSGKTLAYVLPIINLLMEASKSRQEMGISDFCFDRFLKIDFRSIGTLALVLAPTRELAKQIYSVLDSVLKYDTKRSEPSAPKQSHSSHWIVPGLVVGGDKKKSEKARIRRGATILISTPGRLLDHLKTTQAFDLGNLRWLVLDEADRFLELGFEETLRDILRIIDDRRRTCVNIKKRIQVPCWPENRQIILTSATLKASVQKLAETSLTSPVYLKWEEEVEKPEKPDFDIAEKATKGKDYIQKTIETAAAEDDDEDFWDSKKEAKKTQASGVSEPLEEKFSIPDQLVQTYHIIPAKLRLVSLVSLIQPISLLASYQIIIFTDTCDSVEFLHTILTHSDTPSNSVAKLSILFPSAALFKLHGSLTQNVRDSTFSLFSKTAKSILITTDVAARGLDTSNTTHILQHTLPNTVDAYVHRVGRTARLGRCGTAMCMVLPSETEYLNILNSSGVNITKGASVPEVLKPLLSTNISTTNTVVVKNRKVSAEDKATEMQTYFEGVIANNTEILEVARKAFKSHIRAYATHGSGYKHIFHLKNLHLGHISKSFGLREAPSVAGVSMTTADKKEKGPKEKTGLKKRTYQVHSNAKDEFGDGGVMTLVGGTRKKGKAY